MAAKPEPVEGMVIRYDYLWVRERAEGRRDGAKDRPCAIVVAAPAPVGEPRYVFVAAITHAPPKSDDEAVELPAKVKAHLGLDATRSWVVVTEVNRTRWDDPGIVPATLNSWDYGAIPYFLVELIQSRIAKASAAGKIGIVNRT